jgi:hypothetical protein
MEKFSNALENLEAEMDGMPDLIQKYADQNSETPLKKLAKTYLASQKKIDNERAALKTRVQTDKKTEHSPTSTKTRANKKNQLHKLKQIKGQETALLPSKTILKKLILTSEIAKAKKQAKVLTEDLVRDNETIMGLIDE